MLRGNSSTTSRASGAQPFSLGDLLVYPDRCAVNGPAGERHLEPKPMALLMQLASQPNTVVSRRKLLDTVWAGLVVCDQVLTRCVSELRKALGDGSTPFQHIQTIPKNGYCLTCVPVPFNHCSESLQGADQAVGRELDTVAVLPLQMLSADRSVKLLGTGFSRDLTQLLSFVPGLRVVASSSVEHGVKQWPNSTELAQKLGYRYAICGAIEYRGATFRLRLELIDGVTNQQLWARHYDEQVSVFFSVQDDLVQQVARSLSSALSLDQVQKIRSRGAFDLNIYERIQLAEDARRNYNREAAQFIVENLQAVLVAQPANGVAHALLAMQFSQNLVSGWCDNAAETQRLSLVHLQEALRLAPNEAQVLMAAGIAALMGGRHQEAMRLLGRSLEQNPNEAHALAEYGTARFYVTRELAPSIALIEQAEQAAPQHPRFSIWAYRRGICHYEVGDYAAALEAFDDGVARTPNYHHIYLTKALALIAMNAHADAIEAIVQARLHAPELSCDDYLRGVCAFGLTVSEHQSRTFRVLCAETMATSIK